MSVKKIVIIGPESTGKSELSSSLAEFFRVKWVPEYARTYLDSLGRPYEKRDLVEIAQGQLKLEDEISAESENLLFCDTNLIVIKVWSDFKYGETDPLIVELLHQRTYDYYLLCDIDLPWEDDPLREHPNERKKLFDIYEKYLIEHELPYSTVSGAGSRRLANAIQFLQSII